MNDDMKLSPAGAQLIQEFEGLFLNAYKDPIGVVTIGWGHTNVDPPYFKMGDKWTKAQCLNVFYTDMVRYEDGVKRLVKVPLSQNQFDALVSFTYNCGEGNLGKSSLLRKVNNRDFEGAANSFADWNKAGGRVLAGLTRRRAAEALMFRSFSPTVSPQADEPSVQGVDTPSTPSIFKSKIAATAGTIGIADVASTAQQASQTQDAVKHMGLWDQLIHLAHNPHVWVGVGVLVAIAAIVYWRYQDYNS